MTLHRQQEQERQFARLGSRPGRDGLGRMLRVSVWLALVAGMLTMLSHLDATAQDGPSGDELPAPAVAPDGPAPQSSQTREDEGLNLFAIAWKSKWFMLPIFVMSVIVVAVTIERFISLREERVLPPELVGQLGKMGVGRGFDPREAYRLCQQFPSAASIVIRTMLVKIGRPHTEVEKAVDDVSQREAQRLYANVRWLNLAAAVSPLMGLLGTVWGMIEAFHKTTKMVPGQNKANALAEGIYLALVTTLGGLTVAIPASILAHWFEGRIESLFHRIEELMFSLMPQIEKFEGKLRFGPTDETAPPPPPAAPSPAHAASN
ncbi:MAG: MotA/TolQ/ExbB proton channel family protein [Planctomycetales bacterium]|nr:MotA/TolQ/ExbB proton channel family protein [Planctomycetales bacterium]